MTNGQILEIALRQSAVDLNCTSSDFCSGTARVVLSKAHPQARRYLKLPFFCDMVSYGSNVVVSADEQIMDFMEDYVCGCPPEHCFETPQLHLLEQELGKYGRSVCFMAEYFLPDTNLLKALSCPLEMRLLAPEDFAELYLPQWSNALCQKRKELDRLAIAAVDNGTIVGLAGASADCDTMWQIGIDVLPEYRRQGLAAALTARLALEILAQDKVPFYCAAWSNIPSVRNAVRAGFRPAWAEVTAADVKTVHELQAGESNASVF